MTKPRILIADDDTTVRNSLSRGLSDYDCVVAVDGHEALERLKKENFDLLITDVRMPRMDGADLLRSVIKLEKEGVVDSTMGKIILTGYADESAIELALTECGAYRVEKPWGAELEITIKRALENTKKTREHVQQHQALMGQLRESHAYLSSIMSSMTESLIVVNSKGAIQTVNPAACALLGYKEFELLDKPLGDFVPWDREQQAALDELIHGNGSTRRDISMRSRDGKSRCLSFCSSGMNNENGDLAATVLIGRDVTEERQAEEKIRTAEKLTAVSQLISGIGHELNNALAIISGRSQLMDPSKLSPGDARTIRDVLTAARRAAVVVQKLLIYTSAEPTKRVQVRVNELVRKALALVSRDFVTRGIAVEFESVDPDPCVLGDPGQLHQVILNVISNAREALFESGQEGGHITISTAVVRDHVRVAVQDDGPGIPENHIKRMFEPFFTTREVGKGTGLGLSVCYGIIRSHGGTISAQNISPVGARITIELPIEKVDHAAPDNGAGGDVEAFLKGSAFLVVDDEEPLRDILKRFLTSKGAVVITAASGAEALERLGERSFDFVLCDEVMPGLKGHEVFEEIQDRFPELANRFIMLTGSIGEQAEQQVRMFPCVRKPYDLDHVVAACRRCLQEEVGSAGTTP